MTKSIVNEAIADASKVFDTPMAVVDAKDLSRDEKIKILKNWELDARRLVSSGDENMIAERGPPRSRLPEVQAALRALEVEPVAST
ncbi:hypothetical protein [Taklimakanibacter albus]|jgi:hypothetical protein|uniref:Uncharacterized protein n=1 Tax=Taklimakanibacter albus TaxID=2800327 RepID=A0ACC5RCK9_9HYPH|nr:hypothetical protein [Aestuariivirga sp. YIM B02566]MBK1870334.1 hypothetical protein [Aestuariivirga sp. YIM B02566]